MTAWGRQHLPRLLVALIALVAGLLLATSAVASQGTDLRSDRRLELADLLARQRAGLEQQERAVVALRADVQGATTRQTTREAARRELVPLSRAAGLLPVTGPGLTVALDDAPASASSTDPDDLVVHQQDVQAVVNAMWAGGAEAMTLMGQRVISTSAVRCVGNTVVLHGRVYGPPFTVTAIGDPRAMRQALARSPGVQLFRRYVDRFGLGYRTAPEDRVLLPAYDGSLELPSVAGEAS